MSEQTAVEQAVATIREWLSDDWLEATHQAAESAATDAFQAGDDDWPDFDREARDMARLHAWAARIAEALAAKLAAMKGDRMSDMIVGPAGGCAQCYQTPCACRENKRQKMHPKLVETLKCDHCDEHAVIPEYSWREFVCLKCGKPAKGYWQTREHEAELAAIRAGQGKE